MSVTYLNAQQGTVVELLESLLVDARNNELHCVFVMAFPKKGAPHFSCGGSVPQEQIATAIGVMEVEQFNLAAILSQAMEREDDDASPGITD